MEYRDGKGNRSFMYSSQVDDVVEGSVVVVKHDDGKLELAERSDGHMEDYVFNKRIKGYFKDDQCFYIINTDGTYQFFRYNIEGGGTIRNFGSKRKYSKVRMISKKDASGEYYKDTDYIFSAKMGSKSLLIDKLGMIKFRTKDDIITASDDMKFVVTRSKLTRKQRVFDRKHGKVVLKADIIYPTMGGYLTYSKETVKFVDHFARTHIIAKDVARGHFHPMENSQGVIYVAGKYVDCIGRTSDKPMLSSESFYNFMQGNCDVSSLDERYFADEEFAEGVALKIQEDTHVNLEVVMGQIRAMAHSAKADKSNSVSEIVSRRRTAEQLATALSAIDASYQMNRLKADLNATVGKVRKLGGKVKKEKSKAVSENLGYLERLLRDPDFALDQLATYRQIKAEERAYKRSEPFMRF